MDFVNSSTPSKKSDISINNLSKATTGWNIPLNYLPRNREPYSRRKSLIGLFLMSITIRIKEKKRNINWENGLSQVSNILGFYPQPNFSTLRETAYRT